MSMCVTVIAHLLSIFIYEIIFEQIILIITDVKYMQNNVMQVVQSFFKRYVLYEQVNRYRI